jgi:hypothetical protein
MGHALCGLFNATHLIRRKQSAQREIDIRGGTDTTRQQDVAQNMVEVAGQIIRRVGKRTANDLFRLDQFQMYSTLTIS